MKRSHMLAWLAVATIGSMALLPLGAPMADETELTEDYMMSEENIELGRTLFQKRCKFCHGKGAYPGKAPKLKPKKLTAEQIYLRVAYGFRAMPGWEHEFDDNELMALTAYIKSPIFSN